ncbi:hypothetical protein [Pseudomonas sp. NPDC007930]|uniref:hypothetical protein n=1 Tax=Pseudomonas sp. NPDC007930 TaxID=3364417 RepID=UPI0036EFFF67
MTHNHQAHRAIETLSSAFAPLKCVIFAARGESFSFSLVNEHGVVRRSERLYPDQYATPAPLQAVIDRTRQALLA